MDDEIPFYKYLKKNKTVPKSEILHKRALVHWIRKIDQSTSDNTVDPLIIPNPVDNSDGFPKSTERIVKHPIIQTGGGQGSKDHTLDLEPNITKGIYLQDSKEGRL